MVKLSRGRLAPAKTIATHGNRIYRTLVAGVWLGNDDRTPMKSVTGGSLPAEIWKRFVTAASSSLQKSEPILARTEENHRPTDQSPNATPMPAQLPTILFVHLIAPTNPTEANARSARRVDNRR